MKKSFPRNAVIAGIAVILLGGAALTIAHVISNTPAEPSEEAQSELGAPAIDIMLHATRVETYAVTTLAPHEKVARQHQLAGQKIVAAGGVKGPPYAKQLCGIYFNAYDYPSEVRSMEFHPVFGVRLHGPNGTVEIATDLGTHRSLAVTFDVTGAVIHNTWIEDIADMDTLKRLMREAEPLHPVR